MAPSQKKKVFKRLGKPNVPTSSWVAVILYLRPSKTVLLVRPVMACFVVAYATAWTLGTRAEIDPLLIMRPAYSELNAISIYINPTSIWFLCFEDSDGFPSA